jgi:hypothetical protein
MWKSVLLYFWRFPRTRKSKIAKSIRLQQHSEMNALLINPYLGQNHCRVTMLSSSGAQNDCHMQTVTTISITINKKTLLGFEHVRLLFCATHLANLDSTANRNPPKQNHGAKIDVKVIFSGRTFHRILTKLQGVFFR